MYLFIVLCKDLPCIPFHFGSRTFICAFTIFCFPPSLTLFSCFHMGLVDLLISVFHLAFTRFESYGAPISGLLPWLFYLVVIVDSIFCFAVHLHFDLCFGGEGGMPGLSHALVPARSPRGGRLDGFYYFCLSFRRVYFLGPKKSRKIRHANTGLPSSFFLPASTKHCAFYCVSTAPRAFHCTTALRVFHFLLL